MNVEVLQEGLHRQVFLLELDKEFLSVAPRLSARASTHVLLDSPPFLAVNFESF